MKVVVLLSKYFFPAHPKAGMPTDFGSKVVHHHKIHTCRSNYEYWKEKIDRLKAEGGHLSIRQWSDKPYRSPQEVIVDIPAEVVGVQRLTFEKSAEHPGINDALADGRRISRLQLANSDGLSLRDFEAWFKGYDTSKPIAIIHFTNFRYQYARPLSDWILNGETGISSMTLYSVAVGVCYRRANVPYDRADFTRCFDFLVHCFGSSNPQGFMSKVAETYPFWKPFVDSWGELCSRHCADKPMDELMTPLVLQAWEIKYGKSTH